MSYKDDIKKEITLAYISKDINKTIVDIVESIYLKALKESKITGESIESITYSILDGVEESLKENSKELLFSSIDKIIDTLYLKAIKSFQERKEKISHMQTILYDTLNRDKEELKSIIHIINCFRKEKKLDNMESYLDKTESKINNLIKNLNLKGENINISHKKSIIS